ncbi:MAG: NAD(P)-dependent oxidoreductase [Rhodospirillales bacterium]|nr:NAD(P)-dependent oxidoreductase [Rhodospirillales bacterium]
MQFEKVIVTGGSGRLGRYVADALQGRARVTTLDIAPARSSLPHITLDILDLPGLAKAFAGVDAVIHVGALDGHLEATPEDFMRVNALGTWNVLHAAFEAGVHKVVVASSNSSTGINATNRHRPPLYLPMDEDHPVWPTHAYGLSKLINEVAAESFGNRGGTMKVACVRPTFIMFPELVPFIAKRVLDPDNPDLLKETHPDPAVAAALHEPLTLPRCYVEPKDLADLFRLALEHDGPSYELFYGSAGDSFDPTPTLMYVARVYGRIPEVRKPQVYEKNAHASVIDCSRARETLGWEPTSDWAKMSEMKRAT